MEYNQSPPTLADSAPIQHYPLEQDLMKLDNKTVVSRPTWLVFSTLYWSLHKANHLVHYVSYGLGALHCHHTMSALIPIGNDPHWCRIEYQGTELVDQDRVVQAETPSPVGGQENSSRVVVHYIAAVVVVVP